MGKDKKVVSIDISRVRFTTRMAVPILGLMGMGISSYLTYVHWTEVEPVCLPMTDCASVLSSPYAHLWSIPLSLLGLLMYVFLTSMGFLLLREKSEWNGLIALGTYAVALSGTLYSAYLFYLELFEIHAFCSWCLASCLVVTSILVLSLKKLLSTGRSPKKASA